MDSAHWHLVTPALRVIIVRLWNGGKPRDGYAEACSNAVQQVVDRLNGVP